MFLNHFSYNFISSDIFQVFFLFFRLFGDDQNSIKIKTKRAKTIIVPKFLKCVHQFYLNHIVFYVESKEKKKKTIEMKRVLFSIDAMFVHARTQSRMEKIIS